MKKVISSLNLVVSKNVDGDVATEASYLLDDVMFSEGEISLTTITGEIVKLKVEAWNNGELEVC